ncbi:micrococcal nuclease [Oikeobacillus pervagus]|uniref:Micrococcal nuclease n=1 Tax=Oikeobacillus pervagus TaxID=1325931 RepID=A0AAJ1WK16_9BACI|nr:thermonuclease family protein [Oikeobacillus pervagus]MDQ0216063.1 micrococcal nuclease [Oikeobacillus pervagus]
MKKWFSVLFVSMLLLLGCSEKDMNTMTNESNEQVNSTVEQEDTSAQQGEGKQQESTNLEVKGISGNVVKVVDGDTIDVEIDGKKERIRMILVDTPETKHPRLGVQPFGPEASAYTKERLSNQQVLLEMDVQERDQYGRLLAYVWMGDENYNRTLIEKGLARVAVFPPNTKYVDDFREAQKQAQEKAIGIWSIENYVTDRGYREQEKEQKPAPSSSAGDCQIKGNISSHGDKIYHEPGGQFYDVTKAEEMFCTRQEAEAAGYRASKR